MALIAYVDKLNYKKILPRSKIHCSSISTDLALLGGFSFLEEQRHILSHSQCEE